MSRILAIDPSLTSTGLCLDIDESRVTATIKPKSKGIERLDFIRHQLTPFIEQSDVVYIEGYSFGSRDSHAHSLGEAGGVMRMACYDAGVPFIEVAPTLLKMYATGKGNASKNDVLAAAIRRFGYAGTNSDEADALILWHLAHHHHDGSPLVDVPSLNARAVGRIKEV